MEMMIEESEESLMLQERNLSLVIAEEQ